MTHDHPSLFKEQLLQMKSRSRLHLKIRHLGLVPPEMAARTAYTTVDAWNPPSTLWPESWGVSNPVINGKYYSTPTSTGDPIEPTEPSTFITQLYHFRSRWDEQRMGWSLKRQRVLFSRAFHSVEVDQTKKYTAVWKMLDVLFFTTTWHLQVDHNC